MGRVVLRVITWLISNPSSLLPDWSHTASLCFTDPVTSLLPMMDGSSRVLTQAKPPLAYVVSTVYFITGT